MRCQVFQARFQSRDPVGIEVDGWMCLLYVMAVNGCYIHIVMVDEHGGGNISQSE